MSINLIKRNNLFGFSVLNREKKGGASCSGSAKRSRRTQTGWMADSCVYRTSTFPLSARFSKTLSHRSHIEKVTSSSSSPVLFLTEYRRFKLHHGRLWFVGIAPYIFSFHKFLPNLARKWTLPFQFRSKIRRRFRERDLPEPTSRSAWKFCVMLISVQARNMS